LGLIKDVVEECSGLSRTELAHTVCELLGWRRPNGRLKGRECREFLENLEAVGIFDLPERRARRPRGSVTGQADPVLDLPKAPVEGRVDMFCPVVLHRVESRDDRVLWRQLVKGYHYLGYRVAFGASVSYLIYLSGQTLAGGIQFSSGAWRIRCRDQWIGWDDKQREKNLQKVVSNTRFLILPWVTVSNLASKSLSLGVQRLKADWPGLYGVRPALVESLVDVSRYRGGCYRAANWRFVGMTSGRGRMDREGKRHGAAPKAVFVYPLVAHFRRHLKG
jgi:hypothetical protein